jgi:hypothetical protein
VRAREAERLAEVVNEQEPGLDLGPAALAVDGDLDRDPGRHSFSFLALARDYTHGQRLSGKRSAKGWAA